MCWLVGPVVTSFLDLVTLANREGPQCSSNGKTGQLWLSIRSMSNEVHDLAFQNTMVVLTPDVGERKIL